MDKFRRQHLDSRGEADNSLNSFESILGGGNTKRVEKAATEAADRAYNKFKEVLDQKDRAKKAE